MRLVTWQKNIMILKQNLVYSSVFKTTPSTGFTANQSFLSGLVLYVYRLSIDPI